MITCAQLHMALQAVLATGSGRDINRHKYSEEEAEAALQQPVVKALLDLCKFRNTHQAFMGQVCPCPLPHAPCPLPFAPCPLPPACCQGPLPPSSMSCPFLPCQTLPCLPCMPLLPCLVWPFLPGPSEGCWSMPALLSPCCAWPTHSDLAMPGSSACCEAPVPADAPGLCLKRPGAFRGFSLCLMFGGCCFVD